MWELKALLSPRHGFWSEAQSQMRLEIKVSHRVRGQQGEGQKGEPREGEGGQGQMGNRRSWGTGVNGKERLGLAGRSPPCLSLSLVCSERYACREVTSIKSSSPPVTPLQSKGIRDTAHGPAGPQMGLHLLAGAESLLTISYHLPSPACQPGRPSGRPKGSLLVPQTPGP